MAMENSANTLKGVDVTAWADIDTWVVTPDSPDLPDTLRHKVGGKAASLFELTRWGLPVPNFCCLTTNAFESVLHLNGMDDVLQWMKNPVLPLPVSMDVLSSRIMNCRLPENLVEQLEAFSRQYPESCFAVRSSGTLEDGADASFAGLYLTILNVRGISDIVHAIKECWIGLFNERVITYLKERSIKDGMGLALVVQRLVPSDKSGVLFTVDPVRGNDTEMLIEACFGLGEALVSGHVTPDQYRYDWYRQEERHRVIAEKEMQCVRLNQAPFTMMAALEPTLAIQPVLDVKEVAQLVELGATIQQKSGFPVDIEWAKVGDTFYILQSRPITHIGFGGIAGEWTTADFRDGGVSATVCTPYMASLYKSVMDFSMGDYLRRLGLPSREADDVWLQSFYGRPYWNLGAAKHYLSQIPGFNERIFDQGLGINPGYQGDGLVSKLTPKTLLSGLKALLVIKRSCKRKLKENPRFAERQKKRLQELNALNLASLSDSVLFEMTARFLTKEYFENEATYFDFIYDNSNLNILFKESVKNIRFDESDFPLLLSGLSGVSHFVPIEAMWNLRNAIIANQETRAYWTVNDAHKIVADMNAGETGFQLSAFKGYLENFGHHAKQELDLREPRYCEIPEYVVSQVKDAIEQAEENDPCKRNKKQEAQARLAGEKLVSNAPFWKRRSIKRGLEQVRAFLWWREELRDLSTKYYFHVRRFSLAVAERLVGSGLLQNPDDIFFLTLSDLVNVMGGKHSAAQVLHLVEKNRRYYQSFAQFTIPDEIGDRYSGGSSTATEIPTGEGFVGVAGSPGVVTGVARVIANIHDADRLQPGDILVTRCTDPGWTPKFSSLSGVITETGGILSHAAVICREYGIPAILAVKKATTLIKDGETITINGNTGLVQINQVENKTTSSDKNKSVEKKSREGVPA